MIKTKLSDKEAVEKYLSNLAHPLTEVVMSLRRIILDSDQEISERIKWNSLSFYYTGQMKTFDPKEYKRDIVVLNLHRADQVLLVFPTGKIVEDSTGLLQGEFKDTRKTVILQTLEAFESNKNKLQTVIKLWIQALDK